MSKYYNNCKLCNDLLTSNKWISRRGIPGEKIRQVQELDLLHRSLHK